MASVAVDLSPVVSTLLERPFDQPSLDRAYAAVGGHPQAYATALRCAAKKTRDGLAAAYWFTEAARIHESMDDLGGAIALLFRALECDRSNPRPRELLAAAMVRLSLRAGFAFTFTPTALPTVFAPARDSAHVDTGLRPPPPEYRHRDSLPELFGEGADPASEQQPASRDSDAITGTMLRRTLPSAVFAPAPPEEDADLEELEYDRVAQLLPPKDISAESGVIQLTRSPSGEPVLRAIADATLHPSASASPREAPIPPSKRARDAVAQGDTASSRTPIAAHSVVALGVEPSAPLPSAPLPSAPQETTRNVAVPEPVTPHHAVMMPPESFDDVEPFELSNDELQFLEPATPHEHVVMPPEGSTDTAAEKPAPRDDMETADAVASQDALTAVATDDTVAAENTGAAVASDDAVATEDAVAEVMSLTAPALSASDEVYAENEGPPTVRPVGDRLVGGLFEALHGLHFLGDVRQGAEFVCAVLKAKMRPATTLVHLYDINSGHFLIVSADGNRAAALDEYATPEDDAFIVEIMKAEESILISDPEDDPRLKRGRWLLAEPKRSVLCAPVVSDGRQLGILEVADPADGGSFTEDDRNALAYAAGALSRFLDRRGLVLSDEPERSSPGLPPL